MAAPVEIPAGIDDWAKWFTLDDEQLKQQLEVVRKQWKEQTDATQQVLDVLEQAESKVPDRSWSEADIRRMIEIIQRLRAALRAYRLTQTSTSSSAPTAATVIEVRTVPPA